MNLVGALGLLAKQNCGELGSWHVVVAGWNQNGHETELRAKSVAEGIQKHVTFLGPVYGDVKQACLNHAHAFILPSFSEGLPVAALEAFANALPVVMTPQCHLPEVFQADAAIKVEAETQSIARGLQQLFTMPADQRRAMGARARALALERFTWAKVASQMLSVYQWLLGNKPRPPCVQPG
jgi:poly(glycerol-phosphate) alpha-glucosyltransferase